MKRWLISRIATPRVLELRDQAHEHADLLGRERRGRLVEEQQPRLELERPGDRDQLALAAGERPDHPLGLDGRRRAL